MRLHQLQCFRTSGIGKPYLSRAAGRPLITHGVQSGDVSDGEAIVWARTDRPARMQVEVSTTDTFTTIHDILFADALPETDFTAKLLLEDLPPGQDIFYRIAFADHSFPTIVGQSQVGHFRTAPDDRRGSLSFVWSGDTAGQGWGIDESRGGMRSYSAMLRTGRTSSSIPATAFTLIAQFPPPRHCLTVKSGKISSPKKNPSRLRP